MTTPLSREELSRYTQLVDGILATADLETVTRKKVRKSLEKALGGKDLSEQKEAIKDLIEARFDAINSDDSPASNGAREEADDEINVSVSASQASQRRARSDDDDDDNDKKPAKKVKRDEDADARLAAELQAQENRLARSRTTRGASTNKPTKKGSAKKKSKSAAKVKDDGSDSDGGQRSRNPETEKKERKAGGGFQKPYNLSPPLAELLGVPQVSRLQVVKLLWVHIKAHQLQDPTDKRQILCDDRMQAVFKQPKIDMFQMNKQLSHHLYPVEDE